MRKLSLFLALFLSLMGIEQVWAQKSLPYSYGFEEADEMANWTLTSCKDNSSGYGTGRYGLGSSSTRDGSSYVFRFYYNTNPPQYLISPQLENSSTGVDVSFYYKNYSSSNVETFMVGYSTTDTDVNSFTFGDEFSASNTQWTLYEGSFPAGTKYVAVKYTSNNKYYLYLDEFQVSASELYKTPKNFAVNGFTANSVTLRWENGSNETAWNIKYSTTQGFDPETEGTLVAANANPFTLTGLTAETTYYARVQANYGNDNVSGWSNESSFTPSATMVVPLNYNSSTSYNIPLKGANVSNGVPQSQFIIDSSYLSTMNGRDITQLKFFAGTASANWGEAELTIHMTEVDKTTFSSASLDSWNGMETVYVGGISTNSNKELILTLDEPYNYNGGNLLIGFEITKAGTNNTVSWYGTNSSDYSSVYTYKYQGTTDYTYRDKFLPKMDITSVVSNPCKKPMDLEASSISYNAAMLTWTAGDADQDAWQLVISKNANEDLDTATKTSVNATTYNATSLDENSTYYVWVRAYCGADSQSGWVETSFTTLEQYPTPIEFTAISVTGTTATLGWTNGEGTAATAWQIAYSTDTNFDPDNEGTAVNVTNNPYTIEGLTAETKYYAYIRANYNGNHSGWSSKIEFMPTNNMDVLLNNGTNESGYAPIYGIQTDNLTRSQFIIPSSDLSEMTNRQITKITFEATQTSVSWGAARFDVYMAETEETGYTSTKPTFKDWNDMELVKTNATLSIVNNKMVVELDEPFNYTTGNLLIGFNQTAAGTYSTSTWLGVTNYGTYTTAYGYGENANSRSAHRPKMIISSLPTSNETSNISVSLKGGDAFSGKSYALRFGEVVKDASQTFTVTNISENSETVTITNDNTTDFTVSESSFTLAVGASRDFTVTFNYDGNDLGSKSATINVNTFKINASATSVEDVGIDLYWTTSTFSLPTGWTKTSSNNWSVYSSASAKGGYIAYNENYWYGDASTTTDLISPMVGVIGTDDELIISCYKYSGSNAKPQLAVYVSTDNSNWTLAKEFDVAEIGTELTQLTVDGIAKGNYYVKISQSDIAFDYLYGFHYALECVAATIGSTGYTTYASDKVLDLATLPKGLEAYYVTASDVKESTVGLTEAKTAIEAGTGLILKGNAGTYNIYLEETGSELSGNLLVGCLEQTVLPVNADYYVLSKNKETGEAEFQSLVNMGATIPAGKAYLNASGAGARLAIVFGGEGNATSINDIDDASRVSNGAIYNLQGQKVVKTAKGLYIINGKKVVIK